MIRVRVELLSAIHPSRSRELARMHIANDGEYTLKNPRFGSYEFTTFRGRDREALDDEVIQKRGKVTHWPREALHVWNLVAAGLAAMGYVNKSANTVMECNHSGEGLQEVLTALEDSEERAGKLAETVDTLRAQLADTHPATVQALREELELYKVVFGELPQ